MCTSWGPLLKQEKQELFEKVARGSTDHRASNEIIIGYLLMVDDHQSWCSYTLLPNPTTPEFGSPACNVLLPEQGILSMNHKEPASSKSPNSAFFLKSGFVKLLSGKSSPLTHIKELKVLELCVARVKGSTHHQPAWTLWLLVIR